MVQLACSDCMPVMKGGATKVAITYALSFEDVQARRHVRCSAGCTAYGIVGAVKVMRSGFEF